MSRPACLFSRAASELDLLHSAGDKKPNEGPSSSARNWSPKGTTTVMAATMFRHSFDGTGRPTNLQLPRMSLPENSTLRALHDNTASQTSSLHQMIKERLKALSSRDADLTRHIIKVFRQTPKLGRHHGAQIGLRRDDFFVLLKDVLNVPATQESAAALFTRCESSRSPVAIPCFRCAARARLRGCCRQQLSTIDLPSLF